MTACGCGRCIGQRSRAKGKKFRTFKFSQFLFSYKGWSIRNIRKLAPYENFPLYGNVCNIMITYTSKRHRLLSQHYCVIHLLVYAWQRVQSTCKSSMRSSSQEKILYATLMVNSCCILGCNFYNRGILFWQTMDIPQLMTWPSMVQPN